MNVAAVLIHKQNTHKPTHTHTRSPSISFYLSHCCTSPFTSFLVLKRRKQISTRHRIRPDKHDHLSFSLSLSPPATIIVIENKVNCESKRHLAFSLFATLPLPALSILGFIHLTSPPPTTAAVSR